MFFNNILNFKFSTKCTSVLLILVPSSYWTRLKVQVRIHVFLYLTKLSEIHQNVPVMANLYYNSPLMRTLQSRPLKSRERSRDRSPLSSSTLPRVGLHSRDGPIGTPVTGPPDSRGSLPSRDGLPSRESILSDKAIRALQDGPVDSPGPPPPSPEPKDAPIGRSRCLR